VENVIVLKRGKVLQISLFLDSLDSFYASS
jgi:hypothetical protein